MLFEPIHLRLTPSMLGICIPTGRKRLLDLFPPMVPIHETGAIVTITDGIVDEGRVILLV